MKHLKRRLSEEEYMTKDGAELDFKFKKDIEDWERGRKGFIVHQLNAYLEPQSEAFSSGRQVGYIKISYIPSEDVDYYYPTIFHYLDAARGWTILDYDSYNDPGEYPGDQEFAKEAHNRARSNPFKRLKDFPHYTEYDEVSDERWEELAEYYKEKIVETYKDDFERYLKYHVDKPIVHYIHVDEEYRRRGIGFNLYKKMAKVLADKGMGLYASGLQSEYAEKAWSKLKEVLPVRKKTMPAPLAKGKTKTRYLIDYR